MGVFRLKLLGGASLTGPSGPLSGRAVQRRQMALLALLGGSRTSPLSRDKVVALLWPESPTKQARSSLSDTLHVLHKALGVDAIRQPGDGLELNPEMVWCDVQAFRSALREGRPEEALTLYKGPFLDGFHFPGAVEFEHWADGERDELRREARRAADQLAVEAEAAGDLPGASAWVRKALAMEPHDEVTARELMRLLASAGDRAAAVGAYESFADSLRADLDLDPSPETVELARAIREGDAGSGLTRLVPSSPAQERRHPGSLHSWASGAPGAAAAVAAGAVIVLASLGILLFSDRGASPEPAPHHSATSMRTANSLAVLPLRNLSPDPGQDYFSDGLTEELMYALSRVPGLRLTARTSSFAFKDASVGMDSIARALRVRYVMDGSVRREGESLRINVALVDTRDGRELWSNAYDRRTGDVFAIQDEIARSVVDALPLDPVLLEAGWGHPERSTSVEAYDLYLLGREAQRRRTGPTLLQARELFEAALAVDSTFAPAWGAVAEVFALVAGYTRLAEVTALTLVEEAAARALALDSLCVEALTALGYNRAWHGRDFPVGIRILERALSIDPEYVEALHWQGELLAHTGKLQEAREHFELAMELDPLSAVVRTDYGQGLQLFGLHEEAMELLEGVLKEQPGFLLGEYFLFYPALLTQRYERAEELIRSVARGMGLEPEGMALAVQAIAGRAPREDALAALDAQPRSVTGVGLTALTALYAQLGDLDATFEVLQARPLSQATVYMVTHPVFAPLREDVRYHALAERTRFE